MILFAMPGGSNGFGAFERTNQLNSPFDLALVTVSALVAEGFNPAQLVSSAGPFGVEFNLAVELPEPGPFGEIGQGAPVPDPSPFGIEFGLAVETD